MGVHRETMDYWRTMKALDSLRSKLQSPHENKIYVAKEYTKADLRRELQEIMDGLANSMPPALPLPPSFP